MKSYDAVVIGGGPAGITATLYLCRSGLHVALVEMVAAGGQILKTDSIENYPGFPKGIKGWSLADLFAAHLDNYTLDRYFDAVLNIRQENGKHILGVGKETLQAGTVIICSGAVPRSLGLENEQKLIGHGISYCALCDGNFFRDQIVAVVGGGNSALEEALYLSRIAATVHIIHRRNAFRATKIYQERIQARPNILPILDSVVVRLEGEKELEAAILRNVKTNAESRLPVDGLFIFVGDVPQNSFFPKDLKTDAQGFIETDSEMRTNIPGIFAAGDIRSKLCRQVVTAVGDGATAASAAFAFLEGA